MGTDVNITVIHDDLVHANEAIEHAFKEFDKIERLMSIYREDSEISKLNKQGFLENASDEFLTVIIEANRIHELTDGVFDISILTLIELLNSQKDFSKNFMDNLNNTLELVNQSLISINGRSIRFLKKDMKIVVNALAKGFAVDLAIETLRHMGIKHALINAGGDIKTIGGKTGLEPWKIAIRDPFKKQDFATIVKIMDKAVVTSGTYERRIAGGRLSHIINPRCLKEPEVVSSTVIYEKAITADALATALCVMEPSKGLSLIEKLEGAEAMLITVDREIRKTSGFSHYETIG